MHDQLRFSIEHMADLLPVYQIVGVEDRDSGEHGKRGRNKKIIVSFAGNGGVWITALQDRIIEFIRLQRVLFVHRIFTLIGKLTENGVV